MAEGDYLRSYGYGSYTFDPSKWTYPIHPSVEARVAELEKRLSEQGVPVAMWTEEDSGKQYVLLRRDIVEAGQKASR